MNSIVVTRTFGVRSLGKGHCSWFFFLRFPTPGGWPTAIPTVHFSRTPFGKSSLNLRASPATCSHNSREGNTMSVSGARAAHLLCLPPANKFPSCEHGLLMAFTPSKPSHSTPTRGTTRRTTPRVPTSTVSPERYWSWVLATTCCPTSKLMPNKDSRLDGSSRAHCIQPLPSASSRNCVPSIEPCTLFTMNSSPATKRISFRK
mmetsp:Transcript_24616/g.56811  ORF Transcript_24616/g.56811 Transcript_24616/m.56811 type:complete len:203 (+) Transcript_24616:1135-1743(+)